MIPMLIGSLFGVLWIINTLNEKPGWKNPILCLLALGFILIGIFIH
jgi:hypothetical protein